MAWYGTDVHEVIGGLHARVQAGEELGRDERRVYDATSKPFRWRMMLDADDSEEGIGGKHLTSSQRDRVKNLLEEWEPPRALREATDRGAAVARGFRGGLTWGLDDEGTALSTSLGPGGQDYSSELGDVRVVDDLISARHFWPELGGEVLGSIPWMGASLVTAPGRKLLEWLSRGGLGTRTVKQAAVGAPIGATVGFTEGRDGLESRLESSKMGAVGGMAIGAGGELVTSAAGGAWNKLGRNPTLKALAAGARKVGAEDLAKSLDARRGSVGNLSPAATEMTSKAYADATSRFGPEMAELNQYDEVLLGEMPGGFRDLTSVVAANDVPSSYYLKQALTARAASGRQRMSDAADRTLGSVKDAEDYETNLQWAEDSLKKSYDRILGLGMSDEELMSAISRGDPVPRHLFVDLAETYQSLDALGYTRGPEIAAFLKRMENYLSKWGPLQASIQGRGGGPAPDGGAATGGGPAPEGPSDSPTLSALLQDEVPTFDRGSGTAAFDPSGDPRFIGVKGTAGADGPDLSQGRWVFYDSAPSQPGDQLPSEADTLFTGASAPQDSATRGGIPVAPKGESDTATLRGLAGGEEPPSPATDLTAPPAPPKGFEPVHRIGAQPPAPGTKFSLTGALAFRAAAAHAFDNGRERLFNLAEQYHGVSYKRNEYLDHRLAEAGREAADAIHALKVEKAGELGIPVAEMYEPANARRIDADPEVVRETQRLDDYMTNMEDHPERILAEYDDPNLKQKEGLERHLKLGYQEAIRQRRLFLQEDEAWTAGAPKSGAIASLLGIQSLLPQYRKSLDKAEAQLKGGDLHALDRTMVMEVFDAEDRMRRLVPGSKSEQLGVIDTLLARGGEDMAESDRRTLMGIRKELGAVSDDLQITDGGPRPATEVDELEEKWASDVAKAEAQVAKEESDAEEAFRERERDQHADLVSILTGKVSSSGGRKKPSTDFGRIKGMIDRLMGRSPAPPATPSLKENLMTVLSRSSKHDWRNAKPGEMFDEESAKRANEAMAETDDALTSALWAAYNDLETRDGIPLDDMESLLEEFYETGGHYSGPPVESKVDAMLDLLPEDRKKELGEALERARNSSQYLFDELNLSESEYLFEGGYAPRDRDGSSIVAGGKGHSRGGIPWSRMTKAERARMKERLGSRYTPEEKVRRAELYHDWKDLGSWWKEYQTYLKEGERTGEYVPSRRSPLPEKASKTPRDFYDYIPKELREWRASLSDADVALMERWRPQYAPRGREGSPSVRNWGVLPFSHAHTPSIPGKPDPEMLEGAVGDWLRERGRRAGSYELTRRDFLKYTGVTPLVASISPSSLADPTPASVAAKLKTEKMLRSISIQYSAIPGKKGKKVEHAMKYMGMSEAEATRMKDDWSLLSGGKRRTEYSTCSCPGGGRR